MKYLRPKYIFNNIKDPIKPQNKIVKTVDNRIPEIEKDNTGKEKYYSCAGKGADDGEGHCGEPDCEVCIPFGFSKKGNSFQGLAQFFDARILFFPVHSMMGPVWITSQSVLKEQGAPEALIRLSDWKKFKCIGSTCPAGKLNFGWLMMEAEDAMPLENAFKAKIEKVPQEILNRLFLVSDNLFSRIVNDNLEVRTSVAIDPATGAAEDGALYTYEAIPRATVMWFDVVYNKPGYFRIDGSKPIDLKKPTGSYLNPLKNPAVGDDDQIGFMAFNVGKGLKYLETLGVGGMNTRGMGRLQILNLGGQ